LEEDGWESLAEALQKEGFAVLGFDFRGHGGSTSVGKNFWTRPYNRSVRGAAKTPPTVTHQDFPPAYVPALVNDVAAARAYLEGKNDNGECNASNIILIGAEEGATLGLLWLASEGMRYRERPRDPANPFRINLAEKPESKDVIGCVWLSISKSVGKGRNVFPLPMKTWLADMGREKKIPMAFVYGKEDKAGDATALACIQAIRQRYKRGAKVTDDDHAATIEQGVDNSKLVGAKLLGKGLGLDKGLVDYLKGTVVEKFGNQAWEKRDFDDSTFAWTASRSARPILAKQEKVKKLNPIPLPQLGLLR
jgi:hypothetical protein